MAYQVVQVRNFTGGLQTDHPSSIADNALYEATNVEITPTGHLKPRPNFGKRFASNFSNSPVVGIAPYYKSDGSVKLLIAAGDSIYVDEPHMTFDFDTQSEWSAEGVYTNCDYTSSPGDIKLRTPPSPSFIGGSPTYSKIYF